MTIGVGVAGAALDDVGVCCEMPLQAVNWSINREISKNRTDKIM